MMAFEFVRNSNAKCSPFIFWGLILTCFFLLCNWWSLSSQNVGLIKQIANMAEQLRTNGEELDACMQQHELMNEKLKDSQTKFIQQQIKIEQSKENENIIREKFTKLQEELGEAKKKYESLIKDLESCKSEKNSMEKLRVPSKVLTAILRAGNKNAKMDDAKTQEMSGRHQEKHDSTKANANGGKKENSDKGNEPADSLQRNRDRGGGEDAKYYGDSSLMPIDVDDPREKAMREP